MAQRWPQLVNKGKGLDRQVRCHRLQVWKERASTHNQSRQFDTYPQREA